MYRFFVLGIFFFCLNKCYRLKKDKIAELYGMVRLCLALEEVAKIFAKEPVPFASPASMSDSTWCVACSPASGIAGVLDSSHSERCVWYLTVSWTSPMTNEGEHLCKYLFAIFLGEASVQIFCPFFFFWWVVCFLIAEFSVFFVFLNENPLTNLQIFFSCGMSFDSFNSLHRVEV